MWQAWYFKDLLPFPGAWVDQPLDVLMAFEALSVAYTTGRLKGDWDKATPLQLEMRAWIGDDG